MKFPQEQDGGEKSKQQRMREEAAKNVPRLMQIADGFQSLMQNEQIRSLLSAENVEVLDRLRDRWDVEVMGKIKAYEKGKDLGYGKNAVGLLNEVSPILKPAIDQLVEEKLHSWGIDLSNEELYNKLKPETQRRAMLLNGLILDGLLSLDDLDETIADIAGEISDPMKE